LLYNLTYPFNPLRLQTENLSSDNMTDLEKRTSERRARDERTISEGKAEEEKLTK